MHFWRSLQTEKWDALCEGHACVFFCDLESAHKHRQLFEFDTWDRH